MGGLGLVVAWVRVRDAKGPLSTAPAFWTPSVPPLCSGWGSGPTDAHANPGPQGSSPPPGWRGRLPPILPYWSTHFQLQVKETQLKVTVANGGTWGHM